MIDRRTILNRLPKAGRWYTVYNAASDRATIRIFDEVGYWGVSEEDFARDLEQITAPEIEVQISSPGGEVFAGIAIYNQLRAHPAHIVTRVDGMAASAASVIVQAGDRRLMMSSAQMMIHEAWGLCVGSAGDMREFSAMLDKQSDVIAGIYASRSGGDVANFRDLMRTDLYLTDAETVELGLADEVFEPSSTEASAAAASSAAPRPRSLAAASLSRPTTPNRPQASTGPQGQEESAMPLTAEQRAEHGIAEDISDEDITEVLRALGDPDPESDAATAAEETAAEPVTAAASGAVNVEPDVLAQLTADAAAGREARDTQRREERDRTIAAALSEGRITPARRAHYESAWAADPDGTRVLLTAAPEAGGLAPGLVPVEEKGHASGADNQPPTAYPPSLLSPRERARLAAAQKES